MLVLGPAIAGGRKATAIIWKTLLIAERAFRRLGASESLAGVAKSVVYPSGVRQRAEAKLAAA